MGDKEQPSFHEDTTESWSTTIIYVVGGTLLALIIFVVSVLCVKAKSSQTQISGPLKSPTKKMKAHKIFVQGQGDRLGSPVIHPAIHSQGDAQGSPVIHPASEEQNLGELISVQKQPRAAFNLGNI